MPEFDGVHIGPSRAGGPLSSPVSKRPELSQAKRAMRLELDAELADPDIILLLVASEYQAQCQPAR